MYYDSDVKKCVALVSSQASCHTPFAAEVVRACDGAMYYDADVQKCLSAALPLGGRAAEVVRFCDQSRPYDSDALKCIGAFRG